jgi:hypothetical protein
MDMERKQGCIFMFFFTAVVLAGAIWFLDAERKVEIADAAKADPRIGKIYVAKKERTIGVASRDDEAVSNALIAGAAINLAQKGDAHDADLGTDLTRLLAAEKVAIVHRGDRLHVLEADGKGLRVENLTRRKGAAKFWLLEEQIIASPKAAAAKH